MYNICMFRLLNVKNLKNNLLFIKLKTFSKIFTLLRLISPLRVTDNMNTFYNHFLARDTTLIPVNPYILNNCN
jgi:hypothetical protein